MIAVTFAHPSESRDFARLIAGRHQEVEIFHTGIGGTVAGKRVEAFLDSNQIDLLISSGFAGGIEQSLGVATLFLAENFSDPRLLEQAQELLICRVGKLFTVSQVIDDPAERLTLGDKHDADAVDMETEQIANACAARNIPMLSLRAISDTAAAPFPAPPTLLFDLEQQRTRLSRLAPYLLTRPGAIVRLARFTRQLASARSELAVGLKEIIENLSQEI